jgi:uncharacterized protein
MSEAWSKLLDIDLLADGQEDIAFAIPLAELPRLSPQLAHTHGEVRGTVHFSREIGLPIAEVEVTGDLELTCQRCFGPMSVQIDQRERVAMVAGAAEAERVPEGRETILAPEHRISLRDLVEEEVLLSIPIVPLHEPEECGVELAPESPEAEGPADEVQRPFEQLGELLKRGKTD